MLVVHRGIRARRPPGRGSRGGAGRGVARRSGSAGRGRPPSGGGGQASRPVPAMLASAYAARPPGPSGGVIPAASSVTAARLP